MMFGREEAVLAAVQLIVLPRPPSVTAPTRRTAGAVLKASECIASPLHPHLHRVRCIRIGNGASPVSFRGRRFGGGGVQISFN